MKNIQLIEDEESIVDTISNDLQTESLADMISFEVCQLIRNRFAVSIIFLTVRI
jgi:hypothetical protein